MKDNWKANEANGIHQPSRNQSRDRSGAYRAILAANSNRDSCQCDACTNQRVVSRHFMPEGVAELLRTAGIDANNAFHRAGRKLPKGKKSGLYRGEAYWPISGIVDGAPKPVELAPDVLLAVGPSFASTDSAPRILSKTGLDKEPHLLFVKLESQIPWIVDELEELRSEDRCPPCQKCRGVWRWKAFLKRESRLPGWYWIAGDGDGVSSPEFEGAGFNLPQLRRLDLSDRKRLAEFQPYSPGGKRAKRGVATPAASRHPTKHAT